MLSVHNELKQNKHIKSFKLPQLNGGQKRGRYGSYKCEVNGITFDSVMEARFYAFLLLQKAGRKIKNFERQVPYELLPKFKTKAGKTIRATDYIADFVITEKDGSQKVIDVKGKKTEVFRIKEKLFMNRYPDLEFICIQWDDYYNEWRNLEDIEKDARARKRANKKKKTENQTKTKRR